MAGLEVPLTMESPTKERAILDIKVTQAKHRDIIKNLLSAPAGCHTVTCYFGTGKCTVIKVLKDGYDLSAVRNGDAPLPEVIAQDHASRFISACYRMNETRDILHLLVWGIKAGKVTHLLPTWLPYHLWERHSWKIWRGHIFRQLYGYQSASIQS